METQRPKSQFQQDEPVMEKVNAAARFSLLEMLRGSQIMKVVMISILALLLQVPISMISSTISERQLRNNQAVDEIASKWGREQNIIGPFLTVPFEREVVQVQQNNGFPENKQTTVVVEYAHFLAEDLRIEGKTENLFRHRGIFEIPVYKLALNLTGRFSRPDFSNLGVAPTRILWDRASLTILISDTRAITDRAILVWNNEKIEFQPKSAEFMGAGKGIQVLLKDKLDSDSFAFSCPLSLQGSRGLFFAPMGRNTTATLESNWPDPSFQGNWLPIEQTIDKNGFRASWQVASLGRNFSQHWIDNPKTGQQTIGDVFGVNFIRPVDTYRMAERSVKYQFLFLTLTFVTLWLFEVLAKVRLHALHYLLVGGGMCLFFLLELSLAEHLGFFTAYLLAAFAIIFLESCYCMAILKSPIRSAIVGTFITLLYGYLYTLLVNQDYALIAGSIGLFLLLATIMYLTRKVDWFSMKI
jgi:inner membrane protein